MGINNVNKLSLTYVFSIAQDPKTSKWGVRIDGVFASETKRGVDLNVGPLHLDRNRETTYRITSMSPVFVEALRPKEVDRLCQETGCDLAQYKKARAALEDFQKAPTENGLEVLRCTTTFRKKGNRLTGRFAVLRTVERDAAGHETVAEETLTRADLKRRLEKAQNRPMEQAVFYRHAFQRLGGRP